jgi:hypothetical protein
LSRAAASPARALNPLSLQIRRNVSAVELSRPGIADADVRPTDGGIDRQKRDRLPFARRRSRRSCADQLLPILFEGPS